MVHLGNVVHVGDQVHHAIARPLVLHHGIQHILLGEGFEISQVAFPDAEHLQLLALPEQAGHVGLAGQLLVVLGQRQQKGGEVLCPRRQQLHRFLGDLDAFLYHQVGNLSAYVHLGFTSFPVFR